MKTYSQLAAVIVIHCLKECNKAELSRNEFIKKLQTMLDERGIKENALELVKQLEQL